MVLLKLEWFSGAGSPETEDEVYLSNTSSDAGVANIPGDTARLNGSEVSRKKYKSHILHIQGSKVNKWCICGAGRIG